MDHQIDLFLSLRPGCRRSMYALMNQLLPLILILIILMAQVEEREWQRSIINQPFWSTFLVDQ